MDIYEKLGVRKIINASETYTKLGGSLMAPQTIRAMEEAASAFMDLDELLDRVCEKAARLTGNDGCFVTSGASAGVILAVGACMIRQSIIKEQQGSQPAFEESGLASGSQTSEQNRPEIYQKEADLLEAFPDSSRFSRNEIIVFQGDFRQSVPYWKLIRLTGARIIDATPTLEGLKAALSSRTAGVVLFPAPLYERGIPTCEEAIPFLKRLGVPVIVDASAQLPPASNLWYYTRKLGADLVVFSGGKHLRGPQSTGLIAGDRELTDLCRKLASPHERLGRGFKTGKEELAGFITALQLFVETPEEERYERQEKLLKQIARDLTEKTRITRIDFLKEGRLGTHQPLLHIHLPEGCTAAACGNYTRSRTIPVDVGVYTEEFGMPENLLFLNAYNLKDEVEAQETAKAVAEYVNSWGQAPQHSR